MARAPGWASGPLTHHGRNKSQLPWRSGVPRLRPHGHCCRWRHGRLGQWRRCPLHDLPAAATSTPARRGERFPPFGRQASTRRSRDGTGDRGQNGCRAAGPAWERRPRTPRQHTVSSDQRFCPLRNGLPPGYFGKQLPGRILLSGLGPLIPAPSLRFPGRPAIIPRDDLPPRRRR